MRSRHLPQKNRYNLSYERERTPDSFLPLPPPSPKINESLRFSFSCSILVLHKTEVEKTLFIFGFMLRTRLAPARRPSSTPSHSSSATQSFLVPPTVSFTGSSPNRARTHARWRARRELLCSSLFAGDEGRSPGWQCCDDALPPPGCTFSCIRPTPSCRAPGRTSHPDIHVDSILTWRPSGTHGRSAMKLLGLPADDNTLSPVLE